MKINRITVLLTLMTSMAFAQSEDFNLKKIRFGGLGFSSSKETIFRRFGQPKKIQMLDCGFDEHEQSKNPDHQLIYDHFIYVGGHKDIFLLQTVNFDRLGKVKLQYNHTELSGLTTKDQLIIIIGQDAKKSFLKNPDKNVVLLMVKGTDEGGTFTFKNGKLIKFEYSSPC